MKIPTRVRVATRELISALEELRLTLVTSEFTRKLQFIVSSNHAAFQSALPETYSELMEFEGLDVSNYPVELSNFDPVPILSYLADHPELSGKLLAELIQGVFRDIFVFKAEKNCPTCGEDKMGCYADVQQTSLSFCCDECGNCHPKINWEKSGRALVPAAFALLRREGLL